LNWAAVQAGYEYASTNFTKHDPRTGSDDATEGKIIIDGNAAAALAASLPVARWRCGIRSHHLRRWWKTSSIYAKRYRIEEDGKATFAVVQAEDELAAIGAVLERVGRGACDDGDLRPGISLMAEFAASATTLSCRA